MIYLVRLMLDDADIAARSSLSKLCQYLLHYSLKYPAKTTRFVLSFFVEVLSRAE